MKKLLILSLTLIALSGCKNKTAETTSIDLEANPDENMDMTIGELGIDCYAYEGNGSKVTLHITEVGEEVSGTLTYQLLEKDTNTGSFKGYFDDSVLIADYTFLSEGVQSTREVAFQLQNNKLVEGYGEIEVDGTIARFKDMDDVKFTSTMPLSKIECPEWRADCLFANGFVFSEVQQTCLELATLNIKLNPLKDGARTSGPPTYVVFKEDGTKAEVFLPGQDKGILLEKTNLGNWTWNEYVLISWKGYVLQKNGVPIYGG